MQTKYSASFSAGALLYRETDALYGLLIDVDAEKLIEDEIRNNEFIQINSEASRKRVVQEIVKRFQAINLSYWERYPIMTESEKKLLMFYSCLKAYPLIFEFHFSVTIPRRKSSSGEIDTYFYRMRLDEIGMSDTEVDRWSENTKTKTVTVYLRILREAGILVEQDLKVPVANDDFWCLFLKNNETWFFDACFLSAAQKKEIINSCR